MKVKESHKRIKNDENFIRWREENKESVLANVFSSIEGDEEVRELHFGFYNEKDDLLTPFVVSREGKVSRVKSDKVFKHPQSKIEHVELEKVKIELEDALQKARETVKEKKKSFQEKKAIGILQNKEGEHQWNITLVGNGFDIFNVKINAEDGKLISSSEVKLFEQLK